MTSVTLRRGAALGVLIAGIAIGRTARPLVPEAERLTGADLPAKHLIFTFDQGPTKTTLDLSAFLEAHKIHAAFFIDARYVEQEPTLTQIVADGHILGNRAATNRDLVHTVPIEDVIAELTATDELIAQYATWNRKFFRAPFGQWTNVAMGASASSGATGFDAGDPDALYKLLSTTKLNEYVGPIYWNIDFDCFELTDAQCSDAYLQRIHTRSNGIIRFDDTEQTFAAIKLLVPQLETEGYVFDALEDVPAVSTLLAKCDATCGGCTGPTSTDCNTCPQGARLFQGQCLACTVCQPGNYAVKGCAVEADTLCTPCGAGTYQPAPGSPNCLVCGDCSDGDACTADSCHPVTGCTHTKIPSCPATPDASVSVPPVSYPDAGGSRPTGGKIDDENNIAVSEGSDDSGCAVSFGPRRNTSNVAGVIVALCIVGSLRRRQRKRPLSL